MKKRFIELLMGILVLSLFGTAYAAPIYIGDGNGNVYTVNTSTRTATLLGNSGLVSITDVAVDNSGNLWGITFGNIYTLSTTNGAATHVGGLGGVQGFNALVFDTGGTLYTASGNSTYLHTVNTSTGAATSLSSSMGYYSSGDLEFDSSGNLYLAAAGSPNMLVGVNSSTGAGSLIGGTGIYNLFGLAYDGGTMYGFGHRNLFSINLSTGAATNLGAITGLVGTNITWGAGTQPSAVPEPSTLLLLGSSLVGLGYLRRRFKG